MADQNKAKEINDGKRGLKRFEELQEQLTKAHVDMNQFKKDPEHQVSYFLKEQPNLEKLSLKIKEDKAQYMSYHEQRILERQREKADQEVKYDKPNDFNVVQSQKVQSIRSKNYDILVEMRKH